MSLPAGTSTAVGSMNVALRSPRDVRDRACAADVRRNDLGRTALAGLGAIDLSDEGA